MTDRPRATQDASDTPAVVEVPIAEAAERLGLSTEAVRKRIQRGTLAGHKHEGAWYVLLNPMTGRPDGQTATRPDVQTNETGRLDGAPQATRPEPAGEPVHAETTAVDLGPLAELIERQGAEIRQLAEAAAIWQVRAVQAEERLKQLTAGGESPAEAPVAAQEPQHEAQGAHGPPDPSRSWWASWWRRLVGGNG